MRKKMVIFENDEDILHILTHIFEEEGYKVIPISTEQSVVEKVISERPDVLVLDVLEPSERGTILCREIRAAQEVKHIPIIALSTHVQADKLHAICADKVIGKPFDLSILINAVESELTSDHH